jgi:hypothetical protein
MNARQRAEAGINDDDTEEEKKRKHQIWKEDMLTKIKLKNQQTRARMEQEQK